MSEIIIMNIVLMVWQYCFAFIFIGTFYSTVSCSYGIVVPIRKGTCETGVPTVHVKAVCSTIITTVVCLKLVWCIRVGIIVLLHIHLDNIFLIPTVSIIISCIILEVESETTTTSESALHFHLKFPAIA